MKSPFPGMDPYLEPHWFDVQTSLVVSAADVLNEHLPDDLVASASERCAIESEDAENHVFGPRFRILEPITERFLKVIEIGTERLVTVIEFVSPTNKRGRGLDAFRDNRAELLASGINFVEVDLVRSGDWQALLRPHCCPKKAISTYRAAVRVQSDPENVHLYPIRLQDKLPIIVIPLRDRDPEMHLVLQPLIERAYVSGRYHLRLNYGKPCEPPLEGEEAAWAQELLKNLRP